ncbi:MAG: CHASE3 domain-containing protein, partial [Armatimonadetes bacterium]|nr:CHASE3 domain-containing protein [Armatimonadota bacterium]
MSLAKNAPPEETAAAPAPSLLFGSRRIAVRIFIGYLLPLMISLVAGLVVPLLFTSFVGRAIKDYAQTASFVDNAYALRRAARDSESDLRGFLLYSDPNFREQFRGSRDDYRERFLRMRDFVAAQNNQSLDAQLRLADSAYRRWYDKFANSEFAAADRDFPQRNIGIAKGAVNRSARGFVGVETALDRLVGASEAYREEQLQRANLSEQWRVIFTWAIPVVAMVIAVVLARFFAVSITRPIEELRLAAEEVERGDTTRLLTGEYPQDDDEIGDLGHALSRMARTIGERSRSHAFYRSTRWHRSAHQSCRAKHGRRAHQAVGCRCREVLQPRQAVSVVSLVRLRERRKRKRRGSGCSHCRAVSHATRATSCLPLDLHT